MLLETNNLLLMFEIEIIPYKGYVVQGPLTFSYSVVFGLIEDLVIYTTRTDAKT